MISNTRIPKYYGAFREAVLKGDILVCKTIAMEMMRIDALIEDPNVYYDPAPVEGWISFCENEMTLTDGGELKLLDTFKLWGEQIFGWYRFEERSVVVPNENGIGTHIENRRIKYRLTNKQYLIIPRSAAKTLYASCIQEYFLIVDPSSTEGIVTRPTMRQSEETLNAIKTAITRGVGPVTKFMTQGSLQNTTGNKKDRPMLASTKKGIQNFLTNSIISIRPMSIDKLQGLRCKVATIDEWLSGDTKEDPIGAIEQGAAKLKDYLIVSTSSEGTIRNGVGDSIKMELMKILKGEYFAPHISIFYYQLDDINEVADPNLWIKANPNLGKTVSYQTYQRDVERAEQNPEARNDILAKRFNIPLEGFTYFFTYEDTIPHRKQQFWGMRCALGADLSRGDDFCAFTFLFPLSNGAFGIKVRSYISSLTFSRLQPAMRAKYEEFMQEGSLIILEGNVLDMNIVYDDLDRFIQSTGYEVQCLGYDPYNAKEFVESFARDNGPYGIEKVIQGARTESVPLGELKMLAGERMLIFDESLMSFCLGNAITMTDTNGNRKLLKKRNDKKIDNVAALLDAWVVYKNNKDAFDF